jgi:hypothetical protein
MHRPSFSSFLVAELLIGNYVFRIIFILKERSDYSTISTMSAPGAVLLAPSDNYAKYDSVYYLKGAAAGGICCSITHGALTPVDVVKTRVQLDSVKVCRPIGFLPRMPIV